MRLKFLGGHIAIAAATAALLAACSSGTSQLASPSGNPLAQQSAVSSTGINQPGRYPSWMKFNTDAASIGLSAYVSTVNGHVFRYAGLSDKNKPSTCTVGAFNWSGDFSIASDASGNVYVPQETSGIAVYAPKCGSLLRTLTTTEATQGAAVATDGSTVYGAYESPASVQVFAGGSTTSTGTLSDPSISYAAGLAVDSQHDLF